MAIPRIALQAGDVRWADSERPVAVRSVNPFAHVHRAAALVFNLDESVRMQDREPVKHDIYIHDFIMQR
jgi:hypothetical protein